VLLKHCKLPFFTFGVANADAVPMDMTDLIVNPSFEYNQGDFVEDIPDGSKLERL